MDKIAIIGIGCRLPGGIRGPEEFWEALTAGKDMTSDLPEGRWDLESFMILTNQSQASITPVMVDF